MRASRNRIFIVTIALALGLSAAAASGADQGIKMGDSFPDLGSFALEGKVPEALKGKVVLVDFWASWCGPCKESFPAMEELQSRFGGKGLVVVAINLDDDTATMNNFLKKHPVTFAVVRDARKELVNTVNIKCMPTSFILSPDGNVAAVHRGFHGQQTRAEYLRQIDALLAAHFASK